MLNTTQIHKQHAFTMLELLITIAVLGILLSVAIPSFSGMTERYRLKTMIETVVEDLQFARSKAVTDNTNIFVSVSTGSTWCYGISSTAACDCSTGTTCDLKKVGFGDFNGLSIDGTNTDVSNITYGPIGVSNFITGGGRIEFRTTNLTARININAIGRLQTCSDDIPSLGSALVDC